MLQQDSWHWQCWSMLHWCRC